jgi:hypothetical protein
MKIAENTYLTLKIIGGDSISLNLPLFAFTTLMVHVPGVPPILIFSFLPTLAILHMVPAVVIRLSRKPPVPLPPVRVWVTVCTRPAAVVIAPGRSNNGV